MDYLKQFPRTLPFDDQVYESHWQSQFWKVDGARTAISGSWGAPWATTTRAKKAKKNFILFFPVLSI